MDRDRVINHYIHTVLETGHPPATVYAFAKELEIGEREFFEHFASLEALEATIWEKAVTDTIAKVEAGDDWQGFTAQQKLLSFLYAFCDRVLDQRSFFLARFPRPSKRDSIHHALKQMRHAFTDFAKRFLAAGREGGEVACRGALTQTYPTVFFGHLLSVIEFSLNDTSPKFERTDAYIEKSVRLAFDVIGTQAVDSAFDLMRFLSGRSWSHASGH